jgi:curved DNA-binding protein CbpA
LNLPFGASETEIKKRFRKLATIHHPDKNGGSKKSEEIFKVILNAYETLSEKDRRAIYDIKYKQHFQNQKSETPNQKPPQNREYQKKENIKPNVNYGFWIVFVLLALLYLYNANKNTTTGNPKADQQLEDQHPGSRPQSGEIIFKK